MKWQGRRRSSNVDDARGRQMAAGTASIGMIIQVVLRLFGAKGILALVAIGLIGWQMGLIDPAALFSGGGQVTEVE